MTSLRDRYGYLPAPLVPVLEIAGDAAMLRLVATCGGVRVTVPARDELVAGSKLAEAMGVTPGEAIAVAADLREKGFVHIDVPMMAHAMAKARRRRIVELREDGHQVADVARLLGITERAVYLALAASRDAGADDRQLDMFG